MGCEDKLNCVYASETRGICFVVSSKEHLHLYNFLLKPFIDNTLFVIPEYNLKTLL